MTSPELPKSIVIFGEAVKLRKTRWESVGKLGMLTIQVEFWCGRPRVIVDTKTMAVLSGLGKNFDVASRKAEANFLKAAAKRIERNIAETKTLRALVKKHGAK